MTLTKLLFVILLLNPVLACAAPGDLLLLLDCGIDDEKCTQYNAEDGTPRKLTNEPELILNAGNVVAADIIQSEIDDAPSITLDLNPEAAKTLEETTDKYKGSFVYFVVDGKIISNPRIREKITGNQVMLSAGNPPDEAPFWEKIPWLQEKLAATHSTPANRNDRTLLLSILVGLGSLTAALWFLTRKKKREI